MFRKAFLLLINVTMQWLCFAAQTELFVRIQGQRMSDHVFTEYVARSAIECSSKCFMTSYCQAVNFNPSSRDCQLCNETPLTSGVTMETNAAWNVYHIQACSKYLVGGPTGVGDDQLSESTYWCHDRTDVNTCIAGKEFTSAKFARLNSSGFVTGSWIASWNNVDQYIQVDLIQMRIVSGIALQGRDPEPLQTQDQQWVTRFRVLYSRDCQTFLDITDDNGDAKIFDGNTNPTDIVIRNLPKRVVARCIRINPTSWHVHISLRFDVLGC